ncbi:MAG: 50S ribosomal protein L11 [candidate division WOR-3 bacterium]
MPPKKEKGQIKLMIQAGQATPAPPVGPALGQYGVNIMEFCNQFNQRSKGRGNDLLPVIITVYRDNSFDFIIKSPPTSFLLKKAAGIVKGSGEPNREKVASVKRKQLREIAEMKKESFNTDDIETIVKVIEGTANSMGMLVEEGE